jgi:NCS1 family nucleobase:cation symporter-1
MSTSTSALTSDAVPGAASPAIAKAVGAESLAPQSIRIMGRTSWYGLTRQGVGWLYYM